MAKQIKISEVLGGGYADFWNFKGRYLICKGSRGSKKSTTAAYKLIYNIMRYPAANALCVRQTFNTLRGSCWEQLKWCVERLGVSSLWRFTVSPLEATYLPTGQKILFRGCDDAMKITSITVSKGYLCYVWFEEAFEINEETFNKIDLSIRGELPEGEGLYKQMILTFNPWSSHSWIKKRFFDIPNDERKLAMTTNYLCNEWLGTDDLSIFEDMKQRYPRRYEVEGLGNWGISEGLVFDDTWEVKDIDNTAIAALPLAVGLDFGWRDPTAIACMRVDEEQKIIYIFQEFYKSEQTIEDIIDWIDRNGYRKSIIVCDSAEPRSVNSLVQKGIKAKAAKKGQGSILEGIRKLQEYRFIVSPGCENTITELRNYCYAKDKNGEWTDKPEDGNYNHLCDAMRYGIQAIGDHEVRVMSKSLFGL